ncbi:MAG: tripartite tricarboxylate transporter substrate binding protein [Burkholderiales bacterium]|nr:tripartite tricarboxylate transporter substrate binding protein [Burkholderiales bacterium]
MLASIRHLLVLAVASGLLAAGGARAQDVREFPARPLRIITGYLPGGVSDTIARLMAEKIGERIGQRIVIDGRPGAGGTLAMELAAHASPDGYTIFMAQPVITISPTFKRKFSFDPVRAFAPISVVGMGTTIMVVNPATPVASVKELIAYGRSQPPGSLRYGHSGQGSTNHLAGELFAFMTGIRFTPVPYKGAAANILAVLQGEIQIAFLPELPTIPHLKSGRLKALGVTGLKRSGAVPEVPAIAETLKGYEVPVWYGLMVPAKTSQAIVQKLNREMKAVLETPEVVKRLAGQGIEVQYTTSAEFAKLIDEDAKRWAKLVKDTNLVLE